LYKKKYCRIRSRRHETYWMFSKCSISI